MLDKLLVLTSCDQISDAIFEAPCLCPLQAVPHTTPLDLRPPSKGLLSGVEAAVKVVDTGG